MYQGEGLDLGELDPEREDVDHYLISRGVDFGFGRGIRLLFFNHLLIVPHHVGFWHFPEIEPFLDDPLEQQCEKDDHEELDQCLPLKLLGRSVLQLGVKPLLVVVATVITAQRLQLHLQLQKRFFILIFLLCRIAILSLQLLEYLLFFPIFRPAEVVDHEGVEQLDKLQTH